MGPVAASAPQPTDLSISKTDSPDPVVADNNLIYTVRVDNAGPFVAQNVVVTDTLPAGVTFVSTSGCAEDPGGVPTCTLGTILVGNWAQFTIEVTVDEETSGTISNMAIASSDVPDLKPENNTVTEDTAVTVAVPALNQWLAWLLSISLMGAALLAFRRRRPTT